MEKTLIDACEVLFGPTSRGSAAAELQKLSDGELKKAFRRLALRTHPDTMRSATDAARFIEALRAYELLQEYLRRRPQPGRAEARAAARPATRPAPRPAARTTARAAAGANARSNARANARPNARPDAGPNARTSARPTGGPNARPNTRTSARPAGGSNTRAGAGPNVRANAGASSGMYYHGALPRRPLRLAEYLYYSGQISWESLIGSIVWQKRGRPRFGEIAMQLRALTWEDVLFVLRSMDRCEHTGQAAARLRLLTEEEVEAVLRRQQALRKPIGRYFVEQGRMTYKELARLLMEMFRHNARFEPAGCRAAG